MKHIKLFENFGKAEDQLPPNLLKELEGLKWKKTTSDSNHPFFEDFISHQSFEASQFIHTYRKTYLSNVGIKEKSGNYYLDLTVDRTTMFSQEYDSSVPGEFTDDCIKILGFIPEGIIDEDDLN